MKKSLIFFFTAFASLQGLAAAQTQQASPNCSTMTPQEQDFANQLGNPNNKMTFCTKFTQQQRQSAMQMMGKKDSAGNMMTPDKAIEEVIRSTPTTQKSGGACPVK